jgi:ankyrin repeat protein
LDAKDRHGQTPLSYAAAQGHVRTVQLLVATNHVDLNSRDNAEVTPLSLAAKHGYETVVGLLLDKNADLELCKMIAHGPHCHG